ncbi:MAG: ATP-binding cassette, subfamily bacterial, partial [Clostridiales bacterium]|nr:ATP-binding cassette, subfamily bacterial [Clostridiales bacterium]
MNTIKRFVSYYRPYKKALAMDLLCASTVSGIDLIIPLLINYLIYTVLVQSDLDLMLRLLIQAALGLFVLYIIRMFAQYYVTSWGHIMG